MRLGNRKNRWGCLAMAVGLAVIIDGCVPLSQTEIIAEQAGSRAYSDAGGERAEQGSLEEYNHYIQEMAQVSEQYLPQIKEEFLDITGTADIEIPTGGRIPKLEIIHAPYKSEETEKFLKILADAAGIGQWKTVTDDFAEREGHGNRDKWESANGEYNLVMADGSDPEATSMIWLSNLWYGQDNVSWAEGRATLLEDRLSEKERITAEEALENRAEQLLDQMGVKEYSLQKKVWRPVWKQEGGETENFCLRLSYTKTCGGLPVLNLHQGWASETMHPAQYIDIVYTQDGKLLEVKNINHEQIQADLGSVEFLLPFEAVCQIFEQYMRYYQTVYQVQEVYTRAANGEIMVPVQESPVKPGEPYHLYIDVSRVQLGWQLFWDGWNGTNGGRESGKGRLVPVWAFYGTPKIGPQGVENSSLIIPVGGENQLLVTINAEDGTVYGRK